MTTPIPHRDPKNTFVIEGPISELHATLGIDNLLAQIDARDRTGGTATGGCNALDGFHEQIAAASTCLADHEDTEVFACMIGQHGVCGSFGGASKLPNGKTVKAVVSRRGDVLIAHAILSEDTGLLWVRCGVGAKGDRWAGFKLASWCFCFTMLCLTACTFFPGVDTGMTRLETLGWGAVVTAALAFGLALKDSFGTLDPATDPATDILRKIGFANPEYVNLNNYRYGIARIRELARTNDGTAQHADVHCYQQAIEDGKLQLAHPVRAADD